MTEAKTGDQLSVHNADRASAPITEKVVDDGSRDIPIVVVEEMTVPPVDTISSS
jgi:hypothetical protein